MRDYWNNAAPVDEEKVLADVVALIKKAGTSDYGLVQELRNCSELCDRGHFQTTIARFADLAGEAVPAGVDVIMEDPDFDVRVSFMKKVIDATDPAPCAARAH